MTGRELYERYVEVTDSRAFALDWRALDPKDREGWDTLAAEHETAVHTAAAEAVHWVANEVTDAWDRREQRRCPSTT